MWSSERAAVAGALGLLLCAGCIGRHLVIEEKGLTCVEAQQIAITAARRMGYTIAEVIKPTPGTPGVVTASRQAGNRKQEMMVSVFCTMLGAEIRAESDAGGLSQLDFAAEFKRNFEAVAVAQPQLRAAAESGLDVLVTIRRTADAAGLGVDLSGAGILPVSVRITNRTPRVYRFRTREVVLQTAGGDRVRSLPRADVEQRLGSAPAQALQPQLLADRDVQPGDSLTGLLLFAFDAYTRARVVLTDVASNEPEGFAVDF